MWPLPLFIQVDPSGGIAVFCDSLEVSLLTAGTRAWLMFRGLPLGEVVVGLA